MEVYSKNEERLLDFAQHAYEWMEDTVCLYLGCHFCLLAWRVPHRLHSHLHLYIQQGGQRYDVAYLAVVEIELACGVHFGDQHLVRMA